MTAARLMSDISAPPSAHEGGAALPGSRRVPRTTRSGPGSCYYTPLPSTLQPIPHDQLAAPAKRWGVGTEAGLPRGASPNRVQQWLQEFTPRATAATPP